MFALFLTPLGRRIAIGAGIVLALVFCIRWYTNHAYNQGREDEKATASQAIAKAANDARNAARGELLAEREQLEKETAALAQSRAQFDRDRRQIDLQINSRLAAISEASRKDSQRVIETSDDGLDDLIRQLNSELRSAGSTP